MLWTWGQLLVLEEGCNGVQVFGSEMETIPWETTFLHPIQLLKIDLLPQQRLLAKIANEVRLGLAGTEAMEVDTFRGLSLGFVLFVAAPSGTGYV